MFRRVIRSNTAIYGYGSAMTGSFHHAPSVCLSLFFTRRRQRRCRVETRILRQWTVNAIPGLPWLGMGTVPSNNRSSTIPFLLQHRAGIRLQLELILCWIEMIAAACTLYFPSHSGSL